MSVSIEGHRYDEDAPTVFGVACAITYMRWAELEELAALIEDYRSGGLDKSARRLDAEHIFRAAESVIIGRRSTLAVTKSDKKEEAS